MRKNMTLSIICTIVILIMAGCSGNESGTDSQQANNPASSAETLTAPVSESTQETEVSEAAASAAEDNSPVVYFTSDVSAEGLVKIYDTLGWATDGKVAVKISTGEPPASNYLRPELIGDLIKKVDGTIVECNTAYGGSRSSSAMHKQVAEDHGFIAIADFDLMDEEGEVEWPMTGGTRLDKVIVVKRRIVGGDFRTLIS